MTAEHFVYLKLSTTNLCCRAITENEWKNRKDFIRKVVTDITEKCSKEKPLVLISLGCEQLLMELLIGESLFEEGFSQVTFFLVEPAYKFSKDFKFYEKLRVEFRERIEKVYLEKYKRHFPKEGIHFLSRAQNVAKYFSDHPQVVLIEVFPPYGQILEDMKGRGLEKREEDLLAGSQVVKSSGDANAVTFLSQQVHTIMSQRGAVLEEYLPCPILRNEKGEYYIIDWGCKIYSNGTYRLSFSGKENYVPSLGLSINARLQLPNGETIPLGEWISKLEENLDQVLQAEIEEYRQNYPLQELSQEFIATLLERVSKIAEEYVPGMHHFYLADYTADHFWLLSFLSDEASHHYRERFLLLPNSGGTCAIKKEFIS